MLDLECEREIKRAVRDDLETVLGKAFMRKKIKEGGVVVTEIQVGTETRKIETTGHPLLIPGCGRGRATCVAHYTKGKQRVNLLYYLECDAEGWAVERSYTF